MHRTTLSGNTAAETARVTAVAGDGGRRAR